MIDLQRLGTRLTGLGAKLCQDGPLITRRLDEWVEVAKISNDSTRGGGGCEQQDRKANEEAARLAAEAATIADRMERDGWRLQQIAELATPNMPRRLRQKDWTPAQAATEGWCASCVRDDGHLEPTAAGRYVDACRACGDWRSAEGQWPPLAVLRWRHRNPGKRVPVSVVEASKSA